MFPREFGRYIEIFGGSGAVLLGKEPSKFEVYNDIEGELVNFFRVVKNRPAELLLELDLLPPEFKGGVFQLAPLPRRRQ